MESYVPIGYTRKPVGVKGELRLHVEERYWEDFLQAQVLFVDMGGAPVPYFVENIRIAKTPVVKLEEVDSPEDAQAIGGKALSLRESDLLPDVDREMEVETLEYGFLNGFTIYDQTLLVGRIEQVLEFPQQEMALVIHKGNEVFIPLNEHLIKKIDQENQKVIVELPEGLLELGG